MKLVTDLTWTLTAACRDADPEVFFPTKSAADCAAVRVAVEICNECPVRQTCLAYALDYEGPFPHRRFGIYGGLTPLQRNALFRSSRKPAPNVTAIQLAKPPVRRLPPDVLAYAREASAKEVRAWARANNLDVRREGPVPDAIRRAYAEATYETRETA